MTMRRIATAILCASILCAAVLFAPVQACAAQQVSCSPQRAAWAGFRVCVKAPGREVMADCNALVHTLFEICKDRDDCRTCRPHVPPAGRKECQTYYRHPSTPYSVFRVKACRAFFDNLRLTR